MCDDFLICCEESSGVSLLVYHNQGSKNTAAWSPGVTETFWLATEYYSAFGNLLWSSGILIHSLVAQRK
jgi:hypothetical protein